jgi:solute carrier family 25 (mitochondrial carnitine/acylcarnitine transporter), member 20/29
MNDFFAGAISGISQITVGHPFDTAKVRIQNNESIKSLSLKQYFRGIHYPLMSSTIINGMLFDIYNRVYKKTNNTIFSGALAGIITSPVIFIFDVAKTRRQLGEKNTFRTFYKSRGFSVTVLRECVAFSTYFSTFHYLKQNNIDTLISGGIAGLMNWTVSYPIDVIRNRQIGKNMSFKEAYLMKQFWKGYTICAIRAVLVNSVGFWVYEKCLGL